MTDKNSLFFSRRIDQLREINRMTLSHVLCQTVDGITEVQTDAFQVANSAG